MAEENTSEINIGEVPEEPLPLPPSILDNIDSITIPELDLPLPPPPSILEIESQSQPDSSGGTEPLPINYEERCVQLERQLAKAAEATTLRKRLIEIRETESKNLTSKLRILSEAIAEEKRSRTELLKRVESAEIECSVVKDKLRRNLEALERMKGHHERRVTMLSANLEIADIKAQGSTRKLDESHRKNAELKGLLEELNMKLNENKKINKGLEKQLKKSNDKNVFLTSQVALIGQLLGEAGDNPTSSSSSSPTMDEEGSLWKIKNIVRQSEKASEQEKASTEGGDKDDENSSKEKDDEDEGVELLLELDNDDDGSESESVKDIPGEESCYKRVDTSTGPKFILSVSKTFIKLKDLILEKRSLQQQIDGYKNLNAKLETKVDKQEHRLYRVTKELNKTWYLVSKLKVQQNRLTQDEAFLRYELKENRATVERLKKEMLSYKEKWRKIKSKNDESQCVWQQLKDEFAQRRQESQSGQASSASSSPSPSPSSPTTPMEDHHTSIDEEINVELGVEIKTPTPDSTPPEELVEIVAPTTSATTQEEEVDI